MQTAVAIPRDGQDLRRLNTVADRCPENTCTTLLQTGVQRRCSRRSTGSSTGTTEVGAFLRLPGRAATQQNAVLHGRFVACQAKQQCSKQQRTNAALHTGNLPESTPTSMFGHHRDTHVCMERCIPAHASVACRRRCTARTHGPHPHATCRVRRALRALSGLVPNDDVPKEKKAHIHPHIHLKTIPKLKSCQMGR